MLHAVLGRYLTVFFFGTRMFATHVVSFFFYCILVPVCVLLPEARASLPQALSPSLRDITAAAEVDALAVPRQACETTGAFFRLFADAQQTPPNCPQKSTHAGGKTTPRQQ